jgi:hypothetical protein
VDRIEAAVLEVVGVAKAPMRPVNRELFDSRVQTAAALKLLERYARRRDGMTAVGAVEVGR